MNYVFKIMFEIRTHLLFLPDSRHRATCRDIHLYCCGRTYITNMCHMSIVYSLYSFAFHTFKYTKYSVSETNERKDVQ